MALKGIIYYILIYYIIKGFKRGSQDLADKAQRLFIDSVSSSRTSKTLVS